MKLKKIIKEFIDNNQSGLKWLDDVDPNIFSEYKLIISVLSFGHLFFH